MVMTTMPAAALAAGAVVASADPLLREEPTPLLLAVVAAAAMMTTRHLPLDQMMIGMTMTIMTTGAMPMEAPHRPGHGQAPPLARGPLPELLHQPLDGAVGAAAALAALALHLHLHQHQPLTKQSA